MWEGQATTRFQQIVTGVVMAIFALPSLFFSSVILYVNIVKNKWIFLDIIFALFLFFLGTFCFVLAYRLIRGRGVKQGGGILSTTTLKIGGYLFLFIAIFFTCTMRKNSFIGDLKGTLGALFIAVLFFIAAKHRGAMRNIK